MRQGVFVGLTKLVVRSSGLVALDSCGKGSMEAILRSLEVPKFPTFHPTHAVNLKECSFELPVKKMCEMRWEPAIMGLRRGRSYFEYTLIRPEDFVSEGSFQLWKEVAVTPYLLTKLGYIQPVVSEIIIHEY